MPKTFKMTIGSKYQVYKGIAEKTSGGLYKKDIIRTTKDGVVRYKSKKQQQNGKKNNKKSQQARARWTKAFKDAIKKLRKEGKIAEDSILMFNPNKKYDNYPKSSKVYKDGVIIYKEVRKLLEK